ncbi:helix-turn-helix domain-containing protein [Ciceribacter sp. L1K23]|uniref:GlxA family transcriptional regulator n=1 Tax=Ciceribacter sp. L1K23 TaxID=2820276 RepID=UPI001B81A336|nr:helix-turn-helix domain-containing protein [Ciceribacter sp. L1K23]MBR0557371.1 helix-turn-helix domain-containing protein [Ciceribacter sp. L1K23]
MTELRPRSRIVPTYVVLPPHTLLLDVAGPIEVLADANTEQDDVVFDCHFVSSADMQPTSIGLSVARLEPLPQSLPDDAYVIVSGSLIGKSDEPDVKRQRAEISTWLERVVTPEVTLVTICSGALLAGAAGLLDGRECTTHADCLDALKAVAPLARVVENRLYVEDGKRLSSAGVSTGIDLALHLVSRLTSPAVAIRVARNMVLYMRRSGGDPQLSPWLAGRNHIHPAIHRVQDAIMADPASDWDLSRLAALACVSERHLSRLFREHARMSVVDYVNLMRVTLARDLISQSRLDMESVAQRAGFASTRHLRRVWRLHNALPPSRYRIAGE